MIELLPFEDSLVPKGATKLSSIAEKFTNVANTHGRSILVLPPEASAH
jgi:hypothetical protein